MMGARPYQIDVEIPEATLRQLWPLTPAGREHPPQSQHRVTRAGNYVPTARKSFESEKQAASG